MRKWIIALGALTMAVAFPVTALADQNGETVSYAGSYEYRFDGPNNTWKDERCPNSDFTVILYRDIGFTGSKTRVCNPFTHPSNTAGDPPGEYRRNLCLVPFENSSSNSMLFCVTSTIATTDGTANDQISSFQLVQGFDNTDNNGQCLEVFQHRNLGGASRKFRFNVADLGDWSGPSNFSDWNDVISSFRKVPC